MNVSDIGQKDFSFYQKEEEKIKKESRENFNFRVAVLLGVGSCALIYLLCSRLFASISFDLFSESKIAPKWSAQYKERKQSLSQVESIAPPGRVGTFVKGEVLKISRLADPCKEALGKQQEKTSEICQEAFNQQDQILGSLCAIAQDIVDSNWDSPRDIQGYSLRTAKDWGFIGTAVETFSLKAVKICQKILNPVY